MVKQTHNVAMARPIAGFVVCMGVDGTIVSRGSISDVLLKDSALAEGVTQEQESITKVESEVDSPPPVESKTDGKLILAEEIEEGHVSWPARMCESI